MDAAGGGDVQVCTVRFTVSLASNATGNVPAESTDTSTDTLASSSPSVAANVPSAEPSAGLSGGESAGQENGAKVRGVRSATALAGAQKDPTLSVKEGTDATARPVASSSSELGYRTRNAQDGQTANRPDSSSDTDSTAQMRRSSTLDDSPSQVRSEQKGRDGVKASEADLAHGMTVSSPALAVLLTLGGGLVLGSLGMTWVHSLRRK